MNKLFGLFLLSLAFLAPVSVGQATLITLVSPIVWPGNTGASAGAPTLTTAATLTSAGHFLSYVFVAREDMVVSHVGIRAGTAVGSPTLTITVETVDTTTGLPNGAGFGSSAGTTGTVTSSTNVLQALGASATIPKGSVFAVKIALATGTSQVLSSVLGYQIPNSANLPYQIVNTGANVKSNLASAATLALGSSSTTFYSVPGAFPASAAAQVNFTNATTVKRVGLLFTIPFNARAVGVKFWNSGGAGDYSVCLYDNAGAELNNSCTAVGGPVSAASTNPSNFVYFDNTVQLTAGTTYRIAQVATTASTITAGSITLPTTDYRGATAGGTAAQYTTYNGTVWDDTNTTIVPTMDVILDQIDNGTGTGGGRIIGG